MKKYIYLIPLFIFMFLIFPSNANAISDSPDHLILLDSGLSDVQKQEYIDIVKKDNFFLLNKDSYPYYSIIYHNKRPYSISYTNRVYVYFYNTIPEVSLFATFRIISQHASAFKFYYDIDTNTFDSSGSYNLYITELISYDFNGSTTNLYGLYTDYILETNFPIYYDLDFKLYDTNLDLISEHSNSDDLTKIKYIDEVVDKDYTIEDILNADDTIYNLSKELLGELPEEFSFLYSILSLGIGLLIVIVILSPFILLFRVWR